MASAASTACALRGGSADGDVGLLLGDGVLFEEVLVALGGGVGEREVGLRALEVGLRDLELLIDLGGFDDGHELALRDVLADVDEQFFEVAVGASVDGSVVEGLRVAGERDLAGFAGDDGMRDRDGELRRDVRGLSELMLVGGARGDTPEDADDEKHSDDGERDPRAFGGAQCADVDGVRGVSAELRMSEGVVMSVLMSVVMEFLMRRRARIPAWAPGVGDVCGRAGARRQRGRR